MTLTPPASEPPAQAPLVATVRDRLHALYAEVDAAVAGYGPICGLSGRCCRFREFDHILFVSAVEAELLVGEAPPPVRPLDDGATCPWQDAAGRCTARDARPLGCRIYFCDPAYRPHAPELSEIYLARLKQMVNQLGLPWDYAPLHHHLRQALGEDRLQPATAPDPARPHDGF
jgi:Fe-S-cluster containining protein